MALVATSQLITCNSLYGTQQNSTKNSQMLFNFGGTLRRDPSIAYCEIGLFQAEIPSCFYNINSTNNVLAYIVSSTNYTITIPVGIYLATNLMSAMVTAFSGNGHIFTISISSTTGILTFVIAANNFTFVYATSTIASVLGFTANITSSSLSLTLPFQLNLIGVTRIKVCSNKLITNNLDNSQNVLGLIQNNALPQSVISYTNAFGHYNRLLVNTIDIIDISLLDQNGNYIDFIAQNWTITLRLTVYRFSFFNYAQNLKTIQSIGDDNNNMNVKPIIVPKDAVG